MIDIAKLKPEHIGAWVAYNNTTGPDEFGRIKSWNDRFVFVVYNCANEWDRFQDYTAAATDPKELRFIDEIPCNECPQKKSCEFFIMDGSCSTITFMEIARKDNKDGQA